MNLPTLAAPAQRALAGAGIKTLEDVAARTEAELNRLHGFGPGSIKALRQALKEAGLSLKA
ncbi:MAG: helix-hairpin-helix domain-containing protein [bacterium]